MAVDVNAGNLKADLLKIAAENGIKVNESMTKAQIIAAINAQDSAEATGSTTDTGTDKSATQTAAASGTQAETVESVQQGAQDGTGTADVPAENKAPPREENATQSGAEGENDEYDLFAYIGPTLPHGKLKENALFRGKIKDVLNYLSDVLEEYPQVAKLIVPTHKLAKYSAKAKTPGNVVHKHYNDIVSAMHGNKEV